MTADRPRAMRDVFIDGVYERMRGSDRIFFASADFGAPSLDRLVKDFGDRFVNVGIAEQNLINVATGLALEGFDVYAYAIAPFVSMRPFEQIRINLAMLSQMRQVNVNVVGVGAGMGYEVSGPTHHCIEDLSIMRTLPNIAVFSPSDWVLCRKFVDYTLGVKSPKYLRFDSRPLPRIYADDAPVSFDAGFHPLRAAHSTGGAVLVSTGFMTHSALKAAEALSAGGVDVGVIDVFLLNPIDRPALARELGKYKCVLTLEEGLVGRGGLDALVGGIVLDAGLRVSFDRLGVGERYDFTVGGREYHHRKLGIDVAGIADRVRKAIGA